MLLFLIIKLIFIFICGQAGAVNNGTKGKHTILSTNDKLYLAKLSETKMENHWRQHDYQGEKPDDEELTNNTKSTEQDDKSKDRRDGKNERDKKKAVKKKVDKKKANKKKTPFEITGGKEALPHEFPWIVRINMNCQQQGMSLSIPGMSCGGSLISPRVVLAAYHCSCNWERQGQHVDYRASGSVAFLGAHNLNHQTYIKKKIIDVKFPPKPAPFISIKEISNHYHDFALFVLNEPVKFSTKISPICLPSQDQKFAGKTATAAGWGHTSPGPAFEGKPGSPVLKKVQMTVGGVKSNNKIVATSIAGPGHNTCPGDSGGPLMYKNTTSYTLIGTLSGGPGHCGEYGHGLFNKVSDWVNWIKKEMGQLGEKTDSKNCYTNEGEGFGNQDGGGGDDGLDNQDQDGREGLGKQDQDGGDGLGNQDQFGDIWPFGPNQDPLFPF